MPFFKSKPKDEPEPLKVDAVAMEADGTVALLLGHDASESLERLQARVHGYVGFALDGQMVQLYPETAAHPVKIVLHVDAEPSGDLAAYVAEVTPRLAGYGVGLAVKITPAA